MTKDWLPYPHVVLAHLQVGNLIHLRLNAINRKLRINPTQMLILAVMPSAASQTSPAAGVSEVARQLQLRRETVSAQLRGMAKKGLVVAARPAPNDDHRWKRYDVTETGEVKARHVRQLLVQLDKVLRVLLGHELARAHPRAIGLLAKGLPGVPPLDHAHAADGFRTATIRERRRVTSARKAKNNAKAEGRKPSAPSDQQ